MWGNLGILYSHTREWTKSLDYYKQTLAYYEKTDNPIWIARTQLNIGYAYVKQVKPACAEGVLLAAEAQFQAIGDALHLARVRHNLGMSYTLSEDWEEAEHCFSWALEQWRQREDK